MADKNWKNPVTCFVCGKKDKIMKRCGRCQLIFYCSIECQRFDWVTHKANCNISEMQNCDGKTKVTMKCTELPDEALADPQESTGSKYETVNCKNKLHKHAQDENGEQGLNTNNKHSMENCHVSSSQINLDLSESHDTKLEIAETVMQQAEVHNIVVYVKYLNEKHEVELCVPCTGVQALEHFSHILQVPIEKLKLIHKGKLQTELTIAECLKPNSVFLAFGEMAESEDGLETEDIGLIMKQLSVERNVAIKALRKTNSLIDAIFEIGNDM